jgi:transposase InsO family protein
MANGLRQPGAALIAHSDRGLQYTSLAHTDRLDELGLAPSVGSRGDAYDNARRVRKPDHAALWYSLISPPRSS